MKKYPTLEEIGTPNEPGAVINSPWSKPIWQQGAYVTNQMKLIDDRLTLLAGTRWSDLRAHGVDAAVRRDLRDHAGRFGLRALLRVIPPQRAREHD